MWKATLFCNTILLALLWFLSYVIITPAYNRLVQYSEAAMDVPILTGFAMRMQDISGIIPLSWLICSIIFGKLLFRQSENKRNEWVTTHTSITLCIGLTMLLFFSTAAILPILKFGAIMK